ncbi:PREDICTED: protein L-Myc [Tinamus guttatus]|uniref:protein L-Myc n=1 Tax=Tinamus guttatus TaxID=94827 RepID=UPI00052E994C|nr:PREDICTED: protein L-Myc [Tinamus guttatus]
MELDTFQHYFYDHDAEEDSYRSTAPSEDIWKKFELVPTPPLSPLGPPGDKACCSGAEERATWLSRYCLAGEEPEYLIDTGKIFGNLSAFILKDCMWSGFSARERLEKAMTEKLSAGPPRLSAHKPSFAQDFGFGSSLSECVDPAAVFLCPLPESKILPSSGSEGQSDSEGEEIDVVTVEKRQSLALRQPLTIPEPEAPEPEAAADPALESALPEPGLPKTGSAPGSDNEDVAKRKNHNYLERKRRNDLRSRFLALRDQVPGLASCPKTPKVVILSKSSEYLQSLISAERRMAAEKRQLRLRQSQLLRRIAHLQGH